jgi:hypothetical protein
MFDGEIWTLVDIEERPDLAAALSGGNLNRLICPHCNYRGTSRSPLLVHDPAGRRVYFAVPPDTEEHRWREQAQALLYELAGALPEERRGLYLGDVQVEEGLDGVQRAMARNERRNRRVRSVPPQAAPIAVPEPLAVALPVEPAEPAVDQTALLDAVQEFLAADSPTEAQALAARRPILYDPAADLVLLDLVRMADTQGEREIARAINEARVWLRELRSGTEPAAIATAPAAETPQPSVEYQGTDTVHLSEVAYRALLGNADPGALPEIVRDFPALLDPWADTALAARVDAALAEGHELLAATLEDRREALAELRNELTSEAALLDAVRQLLATADEEALAGVLTRYPALLSDAAQRVMMDLAAGARTQGDEALAAYTIECRAMLRNVREGLEEGLT